MTKTKTIKLRYNGMDSDYTVIHVTDSTEYRPGQILKKAETDVLCNARGWRVTITG